MKNSEVLLFAQNVACVRVAYGITQRDLSEKAGLRKLSRIADIERGTGTVNLEEVISICKVLGNVSIDSMLTKRVSLTFEFKDPQ